MTQLANTNSCSVSSAESATNAERPKTLPSTNCDKKPGDIGTYKPPLIGEPYKLRTVGTLNEFAANRSSHGKLGGGNFDEILAAKCAKFGKHNLANDNEDVLLRLGKGRNLSGMRELRHKFIDCCTALVGLKSEILVSAVAPSGSAANLGAIETVFEYQRRNNEFQRTTIACSPLAHTSVDFPYRWPIKKFPINMRTGEITITEEDLKDIAVFVLTLGETSTGLCEWLSDRSLELLVKHNIPIVLDACNGGTVNALPDLAPGYEGDNSPELVARAQKMLHSRATKFVAMEPGKTVCAPGAGLVALIHAEDEYEIELQTNQALEKNTNPAHVKEKLKKSLVSTARDTFHCNSSEFFQSEGHCLGTVTADKAAMLYLFLDTYGLGRVQLDEFIAKRAAVDLADKLHRNGIATFQVNLNWVAIPFPDKGSLENARERLSSLGIAQVEKEQLYFRFENGILMADAEPPLGEDKKKKGLYALRVIIRPGEMLTEKSFTLLLNSICDCASGPEISLPDSSSIGLDAREVILAVSMMQERLSTVARYIEGCFECDIDASYIAALDKFYSRPNGPTDWQSLALKSNVYNRFSKAIATLSVLAETFNSKKPALLADCLEFLESWRNLKWQSKLEENSRRQWQDRLRFLDLVLLEEFKVELIDPNAKPNVQDGFALATKGFLKSMLECVKYLPYKDKKERYKREFVGNLDEAIEYAVGMGVLLRSPTEEFYIDYLKKNIIPIPRITG